MILFTVPIINLLQRMELYARLCLQWNNILRLGIVTMGIFSFYAIEWIPLRTFWAWLISVSMNFLGIKLISENDFIFVANNVVQVSARCTYLDLFLIGVPFVWVQKGYKKNIIAVILFAFVVFVVNYLRLCLTIILFYKGLSRFWSHDILDYIILCIILIMIVVWCFENQKGNFGSKETDIVRCKNSSDDK
jgi:exosortase/archaeosortase family protein